MALEVIAGGRAGSVTDRAVTPVRYDAGGSSEPLEGLPSRDGGPRVLRCALDWLTLLCLVPVTRVRWAELRELAARRVVVVVPSAVGPLPVELYAMGKDIIGKSTAGIRLLLREPDACSVREPATCARSEMTPQGPGVVRAGFWRGLASDPLEPCGWRRDERAEVTARGPSRRCSGVLPAVDAVVSAGLAHRPGEDVRAIYGAELQVQGVAFSSVQSGGDGLAQALWRAVASWLYAGRWADPVQAVEPFTRVGRFDFASDTAFEADPGGEWVTRGIYADGSHTDCFRRFSSRARKVRSEETVRDDAADALAEVPVSGRRALLGKATAGRTVYMGSAAYVLLCIYERSKKRDGDWSILGPTLTACGWDGVAEVVRTEFRASRKWLGDQVVRLPNGEPMFPRIAQQRGESDGLNASELTFSQFLRALPSLVAEFPSRFRHTDPDQDHGGGPRVRDRASSAWWSGIEGAALHWSSGSGDIGRVVSTRRHAAAERTTKQIRTSLVRLVALSGARGLSEVLPSIFDAWSEREFADQREELIARQRARYAVPVPARPALAMMAAG